MKLRRTSDTQADIVAERADLYCGQASLIVGNWFGEEMAASRPDVVLQLATAMLMHEALSSVVEALKCNEEEHRNALGS